MDSDKTAQPSDGSARTEAPDAAANYESNAAAAAPISPSTPVSNTAASSTTASVNESLLQRIAALKDRINERKNTLKDLDNTLAAAATKSVDTLDTEGFSLVPPELLKTTMQQHQQASKEVADLDRAKAKTKPEYDLVLKNAHVREEHSRMQSEAAEKEERVAAAEEASIALESQLSDASRKYKAEVKKRDVYLQQVMAAVSDLQFSVQKKLILTTTVDPAEEVYLPPTDATTAPTVDPIAVIAGSTSGEDSNRDSRAGTPMDDSNQSTPEHNNNTNNRRSVGASSSPASPIKASGELIPEYIRRALPKPAANEYSPIIADDTIELISDAVRTRDRQISSLLKLKREHESMRSLNAEKLAAMRSEGTDQAEELMRQKDEAIRTAVYQFQSERNKLHVDIEDMRKINKEQGEALKNGQRRVAPEKGGFGRKVHDNVVKAEAKEKLKGRIDDLRVTVEDLGEEMNRLHIAIRDGTKSKAQLLRDDKLLDIRIKRDAENQRLALTNLDGEIEGANSGIARTERDCDRLATMVKGLSEQVKFLKEESDANHGARTKPLPE